MPHALKVVHVAGFTSCRFFARVLAVLRSISVLFPTHLKVVEHDFPDSESYRAWLIDNVERPFRLNFKEANAHSHSSSPLVWFSKDDHPEMNGLDIETFLGGHDETLAWCRQFLSSFDSAKSGSRTASSSSSSSLMVDDGYTKNHGFEYDLVVIGGGSGGLAAAKEAAKHGAKVACLDFVKPSPAGSAWGLGGTCVNVGCIPKKLYHAGSLLHEAIQGDAASFGICIGGDLVKNIAVIGETSDIPETTSMVQWETLRHNTQNFIASLNFKHRVQLREQNVTYLNQLAKFVDQHTIEATDKEGEASRITSARFLIAVGGRPSPLSCVGSELASSSDDIFSLAQSPGKTLCVGASYISLECAGFLSGLGRDTTVAVRSILLRGFDRECSDKIGEYMEKAGIKFRREVTPEKLVRTESGQIQVTFSDHSQDTYDTVLAAVGRMADTDKLGLEAIGARVNPKHGRILGKFEQTDCPNVYAVGDVLDGTPELTPVAIQAGILLAKRLFAKSNEPMDYINVCTTVFTPIEYGCVGLSEDDAKVKYGEDNVEVYHREFQPLEWKLSISRSSQSCFAKIIVDRTALENVLGIHYIGPNAGEVLQGYGVAMKCGLTYKTLADTVGIHPTTSEEIVGLSVSKRSGKGAAGGSC